MFQTIRWTSFAFLFSAVGLLITCTGQIPHPIKDAVENGDFEVPGDKLTGWVLSARHSEKTNRAAGEPSATFAEESHNGKKALHVVWDIPDTDSWNSLWTLTNNAIYPVKPGEIFTVTAWIKGMSGFHCGKVWLEILGLKDNKMVVAGIGHDMLNARSIWMPFEAEAVIPEGCNQMQVRFTGGHKTDLFLDDVEVHAGPAVPGEKIHKPLVAGYAGERVNEKLDRGIIALPDKNGDVYIGWRFLKSDTGKTGFNVYRISGTNPPVRLNESPIMATTDFLDNNPLPDESAAYFIRPVTNGMEGDPSEKAQVTLSSGEKAYISIKLAGDYGANRAGVGDLDGDGQYEYIIKQPKVNFDPWIGDGSGNPGFWHPSPGSYKIEAYKRDGTMMWRYDMGPAIEMGVWFSPFVIYDLDGDGSAEVALKGGEGDPRSPDGHVSTGPEFLMILDGKTGKEIARTGWIPREGYVTNEALNRNQLCVAYLDGKTPCIIAERGTYDVIALAAYSYHEGKLHELWTWNDREEGGNKYTGQGAHCVHAADVDGDGRDELVIGSAVVDDNGRGLWSNSDLLSPMGGTYGYNSGSGHGHPDHCVVGDLNPYHPGLEMYICYEPAMKKNGFCQIDAKTGEFIWGSEGETRHGHYGLIADIDPGSPGVELWAGDEKLNKFWLFNARGEVLSNNENKSRLAAFWDGDLQREYLSQTDTCLVNYVSGEKTSPNFHGNPLVVADILGDWREEIMVVVPGEIRIYTTTIPAQSKQYCLMLDHLYRNDVCQESQGYFSLPQFMVNPGSK